MNEELQEMLAAILNAGAYSKRSHPERKKYEGAAECLWAAYMALTDAGFDREQAFDLLIQLMDMSTIGVGK